MAGKARQTSGPVGSTDRSVTFLAACIVQAAVCHFRETAVAAATTSLDVMYLFVAWVAFAGLLTAVLRVRGSLTAQSQSSALPH